MSNIKIKLINYFKHTCGKKFPPDSHGKPDVEMTNINHNKPIVVKLKNNNLKIKPFSKKHKKIKIIKGMGNKTTKFTKSVYQEWWARATEKEQDDYLKEHPKSSLKKTAHLKSHKDAEEKRMRKLSGQEPNMQSGENPAGVNPIIWKNLTDEQRESILHNSEKFKKDHKDWQKKKDAKFKKKLGSSTDKAKKADKKSKEELVDHLNKHREEAINDGIDHINDENSSETETNSNIENDIDDFLGNKNLSKEQKENLKELCKKMAFGATVIGLLVGGYAIPTPELLSEQIDNTLDIHKKLNEITEQDQQENDKSLEEFNKNLLKKQKQKNKEESNSDPQGKLKEKLGKFYDKLVKALHKNIGL